MRQQGSHCEHPIHVCVQSCKGVKYLNKGTKARSKVSETLSMQIGNTIQNNVSNIAHVGDLRDLKYANSQHQTE